MLLSLCGSHFMAETKKKRKKSLPSLFNLAFPTRLGRTFPRVRNKAPVLYFLRDFFCVIFFPARVGCSTFGVDVKAPSVR